MCCDSYKPEGLQARRLKVHSSARIWGFALGCGAVRRGAQGCRRKVEEAARRASRDAAEPRPFRCPNTPPKHSHLSFSRDAWDTGASTCKHGIAAVQALRRVSRRFGGRVRAQPSLRQAAMLRLHSAQRTASQRVRPSSSTASMPHALSAVHRHGKRASPWSTALSLPILAFQRPACLAPIPQHHAA